MNLHNRSSSNGIFGNVTKKLYNAINPTDPKDSGYVETLTPPNIHGSPNQIAMRSYGFSPEESFGCSYDQIFSPVYIWNQRYPETHKTEYNEGLFVLRNVDNLANRDEPDFSTAENATFDPANYNPKEQKA